MRINMKIYTYYSPTNNIFYYSHSIIPDRAIIGGMLTENGKTQKTFM